MIISLKGYTFDVSDVVAIGSISWVDDSGNNTLWSHNWFDTAVCRLKVFLKHGVTYTHCVYCHEQIPPEERERFRHESWNVHSDKNRVKEAIESEVEEVRNSLVKLKWNLDKGHITEVG